MGGLVKVILRESNGIVHKHIRWTNLMPCFVKTIKFINGDKKHISDYINRCNKDYVVNTMEPVDYGIVVFDFKTKTILSCQGYTGFDFIPNFKVEAYIKNDWNFLKKLEGYSDEELRDFKKFFTQGKIKTFNVKKPKESFNKIRKIEIDSKNKKEIEQILKNKDTKQQIVCGFNLDLSPFTLFEFCDEKKSGFKQIKDKMISLGFSFTKEEDELWNEFILENFKNTKR